MQSLVNKIGIFRALQLGDLLCAIPAIRALRAAFPDARIVLIGLPWARDLVKRFPGYIDEVIVFPGYPGLPEQPGPMQRDIQDFINAMQEQEFDLLLQMQGNGNIVNKLLEQFKPKVLAGFCRPDNYCPDRDTFIHYPEHLSEIERHLLLVNSLGISAAGEDLEFPLTRNDHIAFNKLRLPFKPYRYICIHPGSRGSARQWPPAYFAQLGDHLARKGWNVVITGTASERPLAEKVNSMMQMPALNLAGATTLGSLGVLVSEAAVLISNCTGVSHVAAAVKTPSVIISMDGEPERWAPLNHRLHHVVDWTKRQEYKLVQKEAEELLLA